MWTRAGNRPFYPSLSFIKILIGVQSMVSVYRSDVRQAREAVAPLTRPWARTGRIDVEQLAQWAYGVQMVDRYERAGLHAIEAEAAGFEPRGSSGDGIGALMRIEHLGCRIDSGGVSVSDAVHPAAYALAHALTGIKHGERVRFHALAGNRPAAWIEPEHKVRAAVWVKPWEKAQVDYLGPGKTGAYCQVIITWDERRKLWGQEEYRRWHGALTDLAWLLSSRALGFTVTGPAAPAEPWSEAARDG